MSDVQVGDDWWLASDGKWYPPQSAPVALSATTKPPTPARSVGAMLHRPGAEPGESSLNPNVVPLGVAGIGVLMVLLSIPLTFVVVWSAAYPLFEITSFGSPPDIQPWFLNIPVGIIAIGLALIAAVLGYFVLVAKSSEQSAKPATPPLLLLVTGVAGGTAVAFEFVVMLVKVDGQKRSTNGFLNWRVTPSIGFFAMALGFTLVCVGALMVLLRARSKQDVNDDTPAIVTTAVSTAATPAPSAPPVPPSPPAAPLPPAPPPPPPPSSQPPPTPPPALLPPAPLFPGPAPTAPPAAAAPTHPAPAPPPPPVAAPAPAPPAAPPPTPLWASIPPQPKFDPPNAPSAAQSSAPASTPAGSSPRFCGQCGTPADTGDAFCMRCGNGLRSR